MANERPPEAAPKKPYLTPEVRRIRLAADELAATACKQVQVGAFCKKGAILFSKTIGS